MPTRRVGPRGRITLPHEVRLAAGIKPGDLVRVEVAGPRRITISVITQLTLDDLVELYPIEGPVDIARDRQEWEAEAAREVLAKCGVEPLTHRDDPGQAPEQAVQ